MARPAGVRNACLPLARSGVTKGIACAYNPGTGAPSPQADGQNSLDTGESMSVDDDDDEVAVVIETSDIALADVARERLGDAAEIVETRNFTGAIQLAIFGKQALDFLKAILGFTSDRRKAISSATLKVGEKSFEISNMSPDDIARILDSPGFREALDKMRT